MLKIRLKKLNKNVVAGCAMQLEDYQEELEEMKNMTRQEYVAHLRRYLLYARVPLPYCVHHLPAGHYLNVYSFECLT